MARLYAAAVSAALPEKIEQMISGVVRQLESSGNSDITSDEIGALVMEGLAGLDSVAYVRYASVYKDFRATQDFEKFIVGENLGDEDAAESEKPDNSSS